jgi:hypothetical protein
MPPSLLLYCRVPPSKHSAERSIGCRLVIRTTYLCLFGRVAHYDEGQRISQRRRLTNDRLLILQDADSAHDGPEPFAPSLRRGIGVVERRSSVYSNWFSTAMSVSLEKSRGSGYPSARRRVYSWTAYRTSASSATRYNYRTCTLAREDEQVSNTEERSLGPGGGGRCAFES